MLQIRVSLTPSFVGAPHGLQAELEHLQKEVKGYSVQVQQLTVKVKEQDEELSAVPKEVELLLLELGQTRHAINGITEQLKLFQA